MLLGKTFFDWLKCYGKVTDKIVYGVNPLLDKLLFCSQIGTQLGWLINPEEEAIFAILPEQKLRLFKNEDTLPVLEKLDLKLKVNEVFNWLKF